MWCLDQSYWTALFYLSVPLFSHLRLTDCQYCGPLKHERFVTFLDLLPMTWFGHIPNCKFLVIIITPKSYVKLPYDHLIDYNQGYCCPPKLSSEIYRQSVWVQFLGVLERVSRFLICPSHQELPEYSLHQVSRQPFRERVDSEFYYLLLPRGW